MVDEGDCCEPRGRAEAPAVDDRCLRCREKGRPVFRRTMKSLLKPAARASRDLGKDDGVLEHFPGDPLKVGS